MTKKIKWEDFPRERWPELIPHLIQAFFGIVGPRPEMENIEIIQEDGKVTDIQHNPTSRIIITKPRIQK